MNHGIASPRELSAMSLEAHQQSHGMSPQHLGSATPACTRGPAWLKATGTRCSRESFPIYATLEDKWKGQTRLGSEGKRRHESSQVGKLLEVGPIIGKAPSEEVAGQAPA